MENILTFWAGVVNNLCNHLTSLIIREIREKEMRGNNLKNFGMILGGKFISGRLNIL
jgi:hypothetical protein